MMAIGSLLQSLQDVGWQLDERLHGCDRRMIDPTNVVTDVHGRDVGQAITPEKAGCDQSQRFRIRNGGARFSGAVVTTAGQSHDTPRPILTPHENDRSGLSRRMLVLNRVENPARDNFANLSN